ncbi:MAG: cupin domain-containing protein [Candidatus Kerfeldbacteria bacterium]|nr:cupin domain-containing protein [Candidatus Kerfeldbacteria bacterium]
MYYKKSQAQQFTIPGGTDGVLYPAHPKGEQSIAYIEMEGEYPVGGYSFNDVCTETLYMQEGHFTVEYGGETFELDPGDVLMLLPGKKYRTWGKGKAVIVITPSWDKAQNHIITL